MVCSVVEVCLSRCARHGGGGNRGGWVVQVSTKAVGPSCLTDELIKSADPYLEAVFVTLASIDPQPSAATLRRGHWHRYFVQDD